MCLITQTIRCALRQHISGFLYFYNLLYWCIAVLLHYCIAVFLRTTLSRAQNDRLSLLSFHISTNDAFMLILYPYCCFSMFPYLPQILLQEAPYSEQRDDAWWRCKSCIPRIQVETLDRRPSTGRAVLITTGFLHYTSPYFSISEVLFWTYGLILRLSLAGPKLLHSCCMVTTTATVTARTYGNGNGYADWLLNYLPTLKGCHGQRCLLDCSTSTLLRQRLRSRLRPSFTSHCHSDNRL